ncbi:MAG: hypothetical protein JO061_04395 [Acidobacteriaceae bacterium]|nr:hypothetical protein [Acidobacteriaceae bacterium]
MDNTARLIGEVAARYGIRLDPDDPAFALVALNQLVLEDAVEQVAARMKQIAGELERSAESVGLRAGIAVAEQVKSLALLPQEGAATVSPEADSDEGYSNARKWEAYLKWIALGLAAGLALFGIGLLVGARVL